MRKILLMFIALLLLESGTYGQLSQLHLSNSILQNNELNPAFFPEGKWFVGVPILSQVSLSYNNRFSYSQLISENNEGDELIDLEQLLGHLKRNNLTHFQFKTTDFSIGYRGTDAAISIFSNERFDFDFQHPKTLLNLAVNGNLQYVGKKINLNGFGLKARYYREFGFSYTRFNDNNGITWGYRLKLLNGQMGISTPGNFSASMITSRDNYTTDFSIQNGILNISGYDIFDEEGFPFPHSIANKNLGVGLDLGISYNLNSRTTIDASVKDFGFISWKEFLRNYTIIDTTFSYGGLDIKNNTDLIQSLEDSLGRRFQRVTTDNAFTDWNPVTALVSGNYRIDQKTDLVSSISTRFLYGKTQLSIAAGMRRRLNKHVLVNLNVTRLPQHFLNIGGSMVVDAGFYQFYMASDRLIGYNATKVRNLSLSFGMNLIFGRTNKKGKSSSPDKFRFLGGDDVKVKSKEKIYLVIPKQQKKKIIKPSKKS